MSSRRSSLNERCKRAALKSIAEGLERANRVAYSVLDYMLDHADLGGLTMGEFVKEAFGDVTHPARIYVARSQRKIDPKEDQMDRFLEMFPITFVDRKSEEAPSEKCPLAR